MNRAAFLDRVRQAAIAGRMHRVSTKEVPPSAGYVGGGRDLCQSLANEIEFVGGQAFLSATTAEAAQIVRSKLVEHGVKSVVSWSHPLLDELAINSLLTELGIAASNYSDLATFPRARQRELILAADMGITSADFAIAETGTLAVCARPGQERAFSLVPPIHLAIVHERQIIPDLFDLFARLSPSADAPLPSNVALITGPSKTGDIELELTTGVHGPGKWIVVIVRESA